MHTHRLSLRNPCPPLLKEGCLFDSSVLCSLPCFVTFIGGAEALSLVSPIGAFLAPPSHAATCRARDKRTGKIYALKKVKLDTRRDREGFPLTALREVNVLLSLLHPNVVTSWLGSITSAGSHVNVVACG